MNTRGSVLQSVWGLHLKADDVLETLSTLFITEGVPDYIRSDNGSEFTAKSYKGVDWESWSKDSIYRAWVTLGEWIQ